MANLLAIDLGTICGFAMGETALFISGEWDLKPTRFESWAMRLIKFKRKLDEAHKANPITHVVYEQVRAHAGVDAAHCYGALMGVLQMFCEEHGIPYESVPVGTLKKFWTGSGNASKQQMIDASFKRCGFTPVSHNEADAVAALHWLLAKTPEAIGLPAPAIEGVAYKEAAE